MPFFIAAATSAPIHSEGMSFVNDLAVIMIAAGLVTVLFHLFRQPVVLGYILAGLLIGPGSSGITLVEDELTIQTIAELGVIFLFFSIGLHFNLRKLRQVGRTAMIAAPLEMILMIWLGWQLGRWFGWSWSASIFLGAAISISSSTVIIRTLRESGKLKERSSELTLGLLIAEDVLIVVLLAALSGIAGSGSAEVGVILRALGGLGVFLAAMIVGGLLAVPRMLRYVDRFGSSEMLLVATLGLLFGISLLAMQLGYSAPLGAFVLGAIVSESRESGKINTLIEPLRDMFSAIFFVAVGMLIDLSQLRQFVGIILVVSIAIVLGKVFACTLGTFLAGNGMRVSLRVGMTMASIGEFSFVIALLARRLGMDQLYPVVALAAAVTCLLMPYLLRSSDAIVGLVERYSPRPAVEYARLYTRWVGSLAARQQRNQIRLLLRKWILQIALNVLLATGLVVGAALLARHARISELQLPAWTGGTASALWLAAVLAALPLVIATLRKLRAIGMVLGEISLPRGAAGENSAAIRAFLGNVLMLAGAFLLMIWMLMLSSAILPPLPTLLAMLVVIGIVIVVMWQSFIRVYARAQIALRQTFAASDRPADASPRQTILSDASLRSIALSENSPAAGRLIRELELRTRTGASVVGIERQGGNVINPGPDEELRAADRVLLLGTADQLRAAENMLAGGSGTP